ncbi:MAG: hypothetical protein IJP07_02945 [Firmicutes bacterium]|nr:hypothetical protein [Bacillota bacterium]
MSKQRHLSIRADAEMLDKFYFVSKYNGRSGSGQILFLMRSLVEEFEKEHGRISEEELSRGRSGE